MFLWDWFLAPFARMTVPLFSPLQAHTTLGGVKGLVGGGVTENNDVES